MIVDSCGVVSTCDEFQRYRRTKPVAIDEQSGATYLRMSSAGKGAIRRITETGTVITLEWAWGAWADRAQITAWAPIDQEREIPAEDEKYALVY